MKNPTIVIKTNMGTMTAELWPDRAPESVKNFLSYVDDKYYDGTIFHRVISNFMIQGGGFDAQLNKKPTKAAIKNEAKTGGKNTRGTLAMARTSVPDSATSQFFINVKDNGFLDYKGDSAQEIGYCVFGKLTSGLDVLDKIKDVKTGMQNGMGDVPATPVVIESIRRQE